MQIPQLAIAVTGLAIASPVFAQNEPVVIEGSLPVAVVSYADLNISSPAGRHALEGRVTRAASALCLESYRQSLGESAAGQRCFSVAMGKARLDIDLAVARAGNQLASERTIKVAAR
ncbi:MAG TPA: UrcA family protein [Sphingomicrobium sp.]|jgi:UrcA family protein|nr:UrcA family protein [Sphingomicrobium sp.]